MPLQICRTSIHVSRASSRSHSAFGLRHATRSHILCTMVPGTGRKQCSATETWCGWTSAMLWNHPRHPLGQSRARKAWLCHASARPHLSPTTASQWVKEAALPTSELEMQILFLLSAAPVVPDGRVPTVGASTRTHDMQASGRVQLPLRWPTCSGWQGAFGADRCSFSMEGALRPHGRRADLKLSARKLSGHGGGANAMRVSAACQRSAFNICYQWSTGYSVHTHSVQLTDVEPICR